MSKTSIPSPARSHGAITPRRVRPPPKRTRSVASPSLKRTPRLTNILEDAFQLSPLPQRQSILNDDTDIQEPLRGSWWKNLNENSRDMQELYENMNPPVANNVLDDINIEPSSPEKEFSIEIPDSSDGESIQSIATPQRKNIFSNKESTKQNYFKNMTIVQQKRKFSSQQSSDSDDSINIVPKKIFNYTKDKSIGMLPKELLKNLKKDRANTSSSIEVPLKCKDAHNLFGKEPKTKPKISDMGLNNVPSASDVEMHEISSKQIFTLNRRSSVKLHVRSSIQSVIDEDWSQPLPSSTMIGSMSDEETPNHKRISGKSVHLSQSQTKPIDQENSMDNTLVSDNNDNIENPNLSKAQSQLEDISADHNETLVNQSISKNNKSQLKDTSGDHNQTHINESIYKETEKSLNNSNNNQMQNDSIPANIVHEGLGKENSNMTLKDNTRVSESSSNLSVNNSGWDSHRTTRKTMRQTFGKDFTPRKSLRTLVMEKTAKRHTVGNFRSQDISKKTKMSNIYQTNNTHNKTEPGKYFNHNEPPETDDNQSINEESQTNDNQNNLNKTNNEIEIQPVELENQLDYQEQLAEPNDQDETINQLANQEKEIYKESSNYDKDDQIADQEEMVVSNNDDEAENRSEENDEVEQFTNDEQNQSIDQEQVAESYNNYEAENSTEAMNQEENVDCENENSQSNDEEQMSEINNEVENQTEEDEQREMVVTDDEAEDAVQEELRESTIDMPNESYDEEQVAETEANHQHEDENTSGVEQEEMIESINDANKSACEEQMAESSHDEDANQSEKDQEEDEVENHSEDEEQEEIILSDSEQQIIIQSDSEQQIEENDSENQCNSDASNNDEMPETNDENQDSYAEETNNHLNDNEDISQMPQANSTEYPIFESTQAKETAKKGVNRQKMRELIEKIRVENAEKKKRFEVEVNDWRKNLKPQNTNTFFKVPQKPAIKRPKPKETKKAKPADKMFFNVLPPEFFEDIKYKPPKRFQPRNAAWANKHLYTFLEQKLEKKYDYNARVRAEKLVEKIYKFTQDIRRLEVAPEPAVASLKQEMARLKIVDTHFDFYEFIIDFLPQDIRHKVVPSGVNLIPLPRPSVYSSIMTQNNC